MHLITYCRENDIRLRGILPMTAVHLTALIGLCTADWSWSWVGLLVCSYVMSMFFVVVGYHRYFSHRTFQTSRWFQYVLALGAMSSTQKDPLWWAGHHRRHHKYSDTPQDAHSVKQKGFWWAHVGWVVSDRFNGTHFEEMKDFARFPELVWFNRFHRYLIPPVIFAVILAVIGFWSDGLQGSWNMLTWGFFVRTVLLWHGSFSINSLAHTFGSRRYRTTYPDKSRNTWWLIPVNLGECWHNNHHRYPYSMWQGFVWWQIDFAGYGVKLLSFLGLVKLVQFPPAKVIAEGYGRTCPIRAQFRAKYREMVVRAKRIAEVRRARLMESYGRRAVA